MSISCIEAVPIGGYTCVSCILPALASFSFSLDLTKGIESLRLLVESSRFSDVDFLDEYQ